MTIEEFLDIYLGKEFEYVSLCQKYIPLKSAELDSWTRCYNCKNFCQGNYCFTYLYNELEPGIGIKEIRIAARAKAVYRCI